MITRPKGCNDIYGKEAKVWKYVEKIVDAVMEKYNYTYIRTPIFESSDLYHRGVGETSDIVTKETYDFIDRGKRNMTLRPEGTAGVVRSYIENKMYGEENPVKVYYNGTMYRYERPQSGRFREFYQFGVEVFGTTDPASDAEVISIPVNFYKILGLKEIKVNINSLGDKESRENYRNALIEYFKPYIDTLCDDCKERFLKNPLRILDCKVDGDKECMKHAPKTIDYLNEASKQHFEKVCNYLNQMNIEYIINPNVVRGLDYYTHTVFEVEANVKGFGSQNVLCGGGRYDSLVETISDVSSPGVGFALGFERLLTALEFENIPLVEESSLDLYIIPVSENEKDYGMGLLNALRLSGFSADIDFQNRNVKGNFKQADRMNSKFIILLGEEEVKSKILTVKNNHTKEEYKVSVEDLIDFLDEKLDNCECGCCDGE